MEREFITLDLQKEANYIANLFAGDLQGYQLDFPVYRLVFNAYLQDYLPGIVVRASCENGERYLVFSPLANQRVLVNDGTFLDISDYEAKFKKGCLSSEFVKSDDGEWALKISLINQEKICATEERAKEIADAYIVLTYEEDVRQKFFSLERQDLVFKPCIAVGELCWGLELERSHKNKRTKLLLVDIANSSVKTMDLPIADYKEIIEGARFKTNAIPAFPSKNYFFNGRKFRPVEDSSSFMTINEAKEVYANMPQDFRKQFEGYEDKYFAPAICCHCDFSYIIAANNQSNPRSLLIMDAKIGFTIDYNVNIDQTVIYQAVCAKFANDGDPVELTVKGWASTNKK